MLQTIGRVRPVARQQGRYCLASQERNQIRVDMIRSPWASAVLVLAWEVLILVLEAIP